MSSNYGWLAESTILPKRPREIGDVSKASMVDLRAAVYATEETLHNSDASEVRRRQREQKKAGVLGLGHNSGVTERSAADTASHRDEESRIKYALARKAELYDRLSRGEADASSSSDGLVDFELKMLAQDRKGPEGHAASSYTGLRVPDRVCSMEASRLEWERKTQDEVRRGQPAAQTSEEKAANASQRREEQTAETSMTEANRAVAAERRGKRQRELDDRRALLRLKQEARERSIQSDHQMLRPDPSTSITLPPPSSRGSLIPPPPPPPLPTFPATALTMQPRPCPAQSCATPSYATHWQRPSTEPHATQQSPALPTTSFQAHAPDTLWSMQQMGLPTAFTSANVRQLEQDARDKRVEAKWEQFSSHFQGVG